MSALVIFSFGAGYFVTRVIALLVGRAVRVLARRVRPPRSIDEAQSVRWDAEDAEQLAAARAPFLSEAQRDVDRLLPGTPPIAVPRSPLPGGPIEVCGYLLPAASDSRWEIGIGSSIYFAVPSGVMSVFDDGDVWGPGRSVFKHRDAKALYDQVLKRRDPANALMAEIAEAARKPRND